MDLISTDSYFNSVDDTVTTIFKIPFRELTNETISTSLKNNIIANIEECIKSYMEFKQAWPDEENVYLTVFNLICNSREVDWADTLVYARKYVYLLRTTAIIRNAMLIPEVKTSFVKVLPDTIKELFWE